MPKKRPRKAHIWKKQSDNWYVEPEWCATALFRDHKFQGTIHDPCCGMGRIPLEAIIAGYRVTASDIKYRLPWGDGPPAWFAGTSYQNDERKFDNIVTNPPFDDINRPPLPFVQWAITHARYQVALLVPFKWFGGEKRSRILEDMPVSRVLILTPRPSMPPGEVIARGEKPQGGKEDFAWVMFDCRGLERRRPTIGWLHRDKDT